ncbi:MAG: peptide-methionine (R)-S-oxide reductase MsrB [Verrucomicrobiae bacterium]|nr:peptide-methionine (R)-S-oxide reductase MsrB [Verrucomicrobiae bacterium]
MKTSRLVLITSAAVVAAALPWLRADDSKKSTSSSNTVIEISKTAPEQPTGPVEKTDAEWKKELTPEQYRILRQAGTERSNGQVYEEFKKHGGGTYYCAGCNAELFSSNEKFDSHCGWPSFYDPANAKNVKYLTDTILGYERTEVRCKVCDGHLGHVFKGEGFDTPTDKRYCINGTVLKFVPNPEKKAAQEKGKEKSK